MKIFEWKLKKNGKGVFETSLVKKGAMLLNLLKLSDEDKANQGYIIKLASSEPDKDTKTYLDKERKTLTGPWMIPDLKIYRTAEELEDDEDGYFFFTAETIRQLVELLFKNGYQDKVSLEHGKQIDDVIAIEFWFVIDSEMDKSAALGYRVPVGTVMVSFKILSDELWERALAGEFNAFSIGATGYELIDVTEEILRKQELEDNDIKLSETEKEVLPEELIDPILAHFKSIGHTEQSMLDEGYTLLSEEATTLLAITSDPEADSFLDSSTEQIRFKYTGPRDDKNRRFCAEVLDLGLIYRKEDINQMSFRTENKEFGTYSIFKYQGSYGCRHEWTKLTFQKSTELSESEIGTLIGSILSTYVKLN